MCNMYTYPLLVQMVLFIIAPHMNRPISLVMRRQLVFVIFAQYVPRLYRIYPLYKEVTRTTGFLTETAWAGAAFNLFLFMIASNVCFLISLIIYQMRFQLYSHNMQTFLMSSAKISQF